MILGLYGYTDKRPVLYSLMYLLQSLGDVVVITPNRHLLRLNENYSDLGHIGNVLVHVTDLSPDEVWSELGHRKEDFAHIIYDLTAFVTNTDMNIHVLGSEFEDDEEELLDCLEAKPLYLKLMYDGKPNKKVNENIQVTADMLRLVEYIERNKLLVAIPDKNLTKAMTKDLAQVLQIPERSVTHILMGRRG